MDCDRLLIMGIGGGKSPNDEDDESLFGPGRGDSERAEVGIGASDGDALVDREPDDLDGGNRPGEFVMHDDGRAMAGSSEKDERRDEGREEREDELLSGTSKVAPRDDRVCCKRG